MLAIRAHAAQSVAAAGADDPVFVNGSGAVGALGVRGYLGQHGFLGEGPFVDLGDGLLGSDDAVDQQSEQEEDGSEDDDRRGGDIGRDGARRAQAHVTIGPEGAGQPDEHDIDDEHPDADLEDLALDEAR